MVGRRVRMDGEEEEEKHPRTHAPTASKHIYPAHGGYVGGGGGPGGPGEGSMGNGDNGILISPACLVV